MAREQKGIEDASPGPDRPRARRPWGQLFLLLIFIGLCLLLPVISSSRPGRQEDISPEDADCIRCHVKTYQQGRAAAFVHAPFFEKRCRTCHVTAGGQGRSAEGEQAGDITGTVVGQEGLWSKRLLFRDSNRATVNHQVRLSGLAAGQPYRFRLVVHPQQPTAATSSPRRSLWLGLVPQEMDTAHPAGVAITSGLTTAISAYVEELTLSAPSPAVIEVSWQTSTPLLGQVEVEEMTGPDFESAARHVQAAETTSDQGRHPQLRSPEELAIDACYQCHPETSLGTSHPVRLYSSGTKTRIPESLPTVDGMLTCVTCHDSHGAPGKNLVRHTVKTKLCVACHHTFKNRSLSTMFD